MELSGVKFFHRHTGNHGGITIAYMRHADGTFEWNYARCHSKENFSRKIGRNIAEGRFWTNKIRNYWTMVENKQAFFTLINNLTDRDFSNQYPMSYHYF